MSQDHTESAQDGYFSLKLGCRPVFLDYDFSSKSGSLRMKGSDCADMEAIIYLFERLDPDCQRIDTSNDDGPDTVYTRKNRQWRATHG